MKASEHGPIVLNEASFRNVVGFTVLWSLFSAFWVWVLIASRSWPVHPPIYFTIVVAVFAALSARMVGYILCVGGKTVTVLNDGLAIELWVSQLCHLNRKTIIHWADVQQAESKNVGGGRYTTRKLILHTPKGQLVFWSICFDSADLRHLRQILADRLGKEKVKGPLV